MDVQDSGLKKSNKNRKDSHIEICLNEDVSGSPPVTGKPHSMSESVFDDYQLDHDALPEIDKADVDTSISIFGKNLKAPLLIGSMTGGTARAAKLNQRLAEAAEECGVGFCLGSQRPMLEDFDSVIQSYNVRSFAPKLPLLIGNLGAVQLNYGVTADQIQGLIAAVKCDAFVFHLNPLQEAIQPEGQTNFKDLVAKLKEVIAKLNVPVIVKEVGSGISETTAKKLISLGLSGIETSGVGGTSWSKVESLRSHSEIQRNIGEMLRHWGTPTPESIQSCRKILPNLTVIASGGIRTGVDIAKALCLGANAAACALPMLKAAEQSTEEVVKVIQQRIEELKTIMFITGSKDILSLKEKNLKKRLSREC